MVLSPRTTRDFLEDGLTFYASCSHYFACSHSAQLDMGMLIQRLGWAFDLYAGREVLVRRLVCSVCGWRNPELRLCTVSPKAVGAAHGSWQPMSVEESVKAHFERRAGEAARPDPYPDAWRGKVGRVRRFGRRR